MTHRPGRWAALAGLLLGSAAGAQNVTVKPLLDARLRYEHVDQAGFAQDADALTLRLRPGVEADAGPWSALIEAEGTLAIVNDYNDGTNGRTAFPATIDPRNLELNRAQIRYAGREGLTMTFGRQLIELADQRFVGSSSFRQNQQTFDATRLQYGRPSGPFVDLTYAWSDRTVNGDNGTGARPTAISGDNVFLLAGWRGHGLTLTGFGYLVDQDEAAVQAFRLSSQTWGLRLNGSTRLAPHAQLAYVLSWARQSDWHHNPNDYQADYWLAEATLTARRLSATAGYEVLGADDGRAFTSVQTPLASFFKFQGWAGRYNPTPPDGVRDAYATIGYAHAPFTLGATFHRFDSDRASVHQGDELDLVAGVRRGRAQLTARYARYDADAFSTDIDRFWLSLDFVL